MLDMSQPRRGPSPRRLFAIAPRRRRAACFYLTLSYGYADHAPAPHGVRVAVAAPSGVAGEGERRASRTPRRAVSRSVAAPSAAAVRSGVLSQSVAGGLVTGKVGPVTIVTAAAAGSSQQQAVTAALTAAADAMHRPARTLDVAPLPPGDRTGLSVFVFELGLLIPSVLASIGLHAGWRAAVCCASPPPPRSRCWPPPGACWCWTPSWAP